MIRLFQKILMNLFQAKDPLGVPLIFDPMEQFDETPGDDRNIARCMNAAFLINLTGKTHPAFEQAKDYLDTMASSSRWGPIAGFYKKGVRSILEEIENRCKTDPDLAERLESLCEWSAAPAETKDPAEAAEKTWAFFFPEASGINADREACVKSLREKRMVCINALNPSPVSDPAREILFTSNVLLTVPLVKKALQELPVNDELKKAIAPVLKEDQLFWYDHPIPIGIKRDQNEISYGLRGLKEALVFERERGNASASDRLTCLLSVSVTHQGLHSIAKEYIQEELKDSGLADSVDLYVFTETDAEMIRKEILCPAAQHYLQSSGADECLRVFGVDGEYGRHYSFLKAMAPFWQILIRPEIRATFKIDLDQVFPQQELALQTGSTAFDHFRSPLWGAKGIDSKGKAVELGMIAGALVNEKDIEGSLFSPDVPYPDRRLSADEFIFFSALPQALSTEAEMGTRYRNGRPDGKTTCLQRVHVTGGTNGILVDALIRHRPFTPSFIGRAEDQAYLLSTLPHRGERLAYVHQDGLIMRHDKEAFAQEAIQSAFVPKLIGDLVRTLYFSAYGRVLSKDISRIKEEVDPFTGCFISMIPATVVHLRFSLTAASFFAKGEASHGLEFVKNGAERLDRALDFVEGENSGLEQIYRQERLSWDLYYETLTALKNALNDGDSIALSLRKQARKIIGHCAVGL